MSEKLDVVDMIIETLRAHEKDFDGKLLRLERAVDKVESLAGIMEDKVFGGLGK